MVDDGSGRSRAELPGDALYDAAGADGRVDVVVEVNTPTARIDLDVRQRPGVLSHVPVRVGIPSPEEQSEIDRLVVAARNLLTEVTGEEPVWLGAAHAFRMTATPDQLRALATSELFRSIAPNRRLQ